MDGASGLERPSRIFKPTILLHHKVQENSSNFVNKPEITGPSVCKRMPFSDQILFPWLNLASGGNRFNADMNHRKTRLPCSLPCPLATCPNPQYTMQHSNKVLNGSEKPNSYSMLQNTQDSTGGPHVSSYIENARTTKSIFNDAEKVKLTNKGLTVSCTDKTVKGVNIANGFQLQSGYVCNGESIPMGKTFVSSNNSSTGSSNKELEQTANRKRYKCPFCNVTCSNMGQLRGHLRCHTGEKPFECDVNGCSRKFARNEELTRHKRIHTGVRPFACRSCKKSFGRKDHLQKHEKTHLKSHEKKTYLCLVCKQGYSRSDALARHKATAHSEHGRNTKK